MAAINYYGRKLCIATVKPEIEPSSVTMIKGDPDLTPSARSSKHLTDIFYGSLAESCLL